NHQWGDEKAGMKESLRKDAPMLGLAGEIVAFRERVHGTYRYDWQLRFTKAGPDQRYNPAVALLGSSELYLVKEVVQRIERMLLNKSVRPPQADMRHECRINSSLTIEYTYVVGVPRCRLWVASSTFRFAHDVSES